MNILIVVKECWEEDPKLLIQTILAGAALAMLVPICIIAMFAMM
jgi:hypothetical protein